MPTPQGVAYSPETNKLFVGSDEGKLYIYDGTTFDLITAIGSGDPRLTLNKEAIPASGAAFAVCYQSDYSRPLDAAHGKCAGGSFAAKQSRRSPSEILQSDVYLHDQSVRIWDQLARSDAEKRRTAISTVCETNIA